MRGEANRGANEKGRHIMAINTAINRITLKLAGACVAAALLLGVSAPRAEAQGLLGGLGVAGLYVGAQLGFERSELNRSAYNLGGLATAGSGGNERDFVGGILGGLEFPIANPFYVGVEGYWEGRVAEIQEFSSEHRVGVNAVLGYQFARLVDFFALAGPHWAQVKLPAVSNTAVGGLQRSGTPGVDEFVLGFSVGFGARYAVTPNWLVRAQYNFSQVETSYDQTLDERADMDSEFVQQSSVSPDVRNRSHSLTVGFTYMF